MGAPPAVKTKTAVTLAVAAGVWLILGWAVYFWGPLVMGYGYYMCLVDAAPREENDFLRKQTEQAIVWWQRGASRGDVTSMRTLGDVYSQSWMGIPEDYPTSAAWYHMAAERGDTHSMMHLSLMYWKGRGVEKDQLKAREWAAKYRETGGFSSEYFEQYYIGMYLLAIRLTMGQ
ncbi:MAG: sel1 repeat family protein [Deltaproteobacteria bacterium]|nr:sel1 repeat family protein [Deltaproteobacteria bacterium]